MKLIAPLCAALLGMTVLVLGCGGDDTATTGGGSTSTSTSSSTAAGGSGGEGGASTSTSSGSTSAGGSGGDGGGGCSPEDDQNECTEDSCEAGAPVHTPLPAGTPCAEGAAFCAPEGQCVECLGPEDCDGEDDACQTRTCTAGVCGFDFAAQGTVLPVQEAGDCQVMVCSGDGAAIEQPDETDLPVDDNECTEDLCAQGAPQNPAKAEGTGCGTGAGGAPLVCNAAGVCVGCLVASDCPGTDDKCKTRTCSAGACGFSFAPLGTSIPPQTLGDCLTAICDGAGNATSLPNNNDLPPDDGNPCTASACNQGVPAHPAVMNGAVCSDGDPCTTADTCVDGACSSGPPAVCPAPDACHEAGTCDPASGACEYAAKPAGTACDDGDLCTQTDTCQAGVCTGSNTTVCSAVDPCHVAGTCDPATGICSNPNKPDGSTCNDGNACTQADTCQSGACAGGSPVVCVASDSCHVAGTCDPATGACSNPPKQDGAACSDGNACTLMDSCQSGACTPAISVVCTASDQCHDAGVCNPTTGACSNPIKAPGSACSDGSACTTNDFCTFAGACSGGPPVVCKAASQCHQVGTCNPATGACSSLLKPDGTACTDGDACTQGEACSAGVCLGAAPLGCGPGQACTGGVCAGPCSGAMGLPGLPIAKAGDAPWAIAHADFDSDGKVDIVTVNQLSDSVSVLVNQGNGAFAPAVSYPAGDVPLGVAAADLNGDGKADLAVVSYGTDSLLVRLNQGNGTFGPITSYPTGVDPTAVAAADVNADGARDLLVANSVSSTVSVYLNLGAGTFAPAVSYAVGSSPTSLVAVDLDGDGAADLATAGGSGHLTVRLNLGNGTFGPIMDDDAGSFARSLSAADLNGDGLVDLAVSHYWEDYASVMLNIGGGWFAPRVDYEVDLGTQTWGLAIADMNGDGHADLLVSTLTADDVHLLPNNGDGTFGASTEHSTGAEPRAIAAVDLNGDGAVDMAVACSDSDYVRVHLNQGNGTFDTYPLFPTPLGLGSIQAGDLDGDAIPDAVVTSGLGHMQVLKGLGNATFGPALVHTGGLNPEAAALADVDQSGFLDIVVAYRSTDNVHVFANTGAGTFTGAGSYVVGDGPVGVAAADLNQDGKVDVVTANSTGDDVSVLLNQGFGVLGAPVHYAAGNDPRSVATGDLDGDGTIDLVVASRQSDDLQVLFGTGTGTFGPAVSYGVSDGPGRVITVDLNGDGALDIVTSSFAGRALDLLLNSGNGTFNGGLTFPVSAGPGEPRAGDMDLDGDMDLVLYTGGNDILLVRNQGSFVFTSEPYAGRHGPTGLALADIDADGRLDVVTSHSVNGAGVSYRLNTCAP